MKDQEKQTISEMNTALSQWAGKFLTGNAPTKLKRTRRLSLSEAYRASLRERMRMRVFGHYGEK